MDELPSSIRQEVEEYLKNPPITSKNKAQTTDVAEKSFTQVMDHIDESVLNELPPEMRREISIAQKLRQIESKYPPIGGKRVQPAVTTSKEKGNAFNVLMNSPQKSTTTTSTTNSNNNNNNKKSTTSMKKWRTDALINEESNLPRSHSETRLNTMIETNPSQPSIAGCSSLSDVKLMLREWIESNDEPASIDVDLFQSYLIQLLNTFNAEMVQNLLIYGLRQIETLEKRTWNENFQRMIDAVQTRFRQMYGGAKMSLV